MTFGAPCKGRSSPHLSVVEVSFHVRFRVFPFELSSVEAAEVDEVDAELADGEVDGDEEGHGGSGLVGAKGTFWRSCLWAVAWLVVFFSLLLFPAPAQ